MSHCHGKQNFWTSTNHGPENMTEKTKKLTCMTFNPVHNRTQDQKGSPYFSFTIQQYK